MGSSLSQVSPTNSIDYLPHNALQRAVNDGVNHIAALTKSALGPGYAGCTHAARHTKHISQSRHDNDAAH